MGNTDKYIGKQVKNTLKTKLYTTAMSATRDLAEPIAKGLYESIIKGCEVEAGKGVFFYALSADVLVHYNGSTELNKTVTSILEDMLEKEDLHITDGRKEQFSSPKYIIEFKEPTLLE